MNDIYISSYESKETLTDVQIRKISEAIYKAVEEAISDQYRSSYERKNESESLE